MAFVLRPPGAPESLPDSLADLGRYRKRVAFASGVFALGALVLFSVALACGLDAAFHFPRLGRGLALAAVLALAGATWLRGVGRAVRLRTDALSVAMELEEKYPALNDALASAVDFEGAADPEERGVSNRLQTSAVRFARRMAGRHDLDRLAPTGRCWRNGWLCALAVAVTVPLALANTERAGVALTRLADPFGHHPWPTKTRLEILDPAEFPARMPRGEPFDLKFAVRGVINDRAVVTFRIDGGEEFEEAFPLAPGNDPKYRDAAVVTARVETARLTNSFAFKVASNDAETDWKRVDVVPPPRLVPFVGPGGRQSPQFHVTPPAYTGLPALDLPDGASALEVPVGTVVRMRAHADTRLASAVLAFTGDKTPATQPAGVAFLGHTNPFAAAGMQALADAVANDIPVSLDDTGTVLTAVFAPALSGVYSLRLTDETGLVGSRLIEIRVVPDPVPTVTLLRPSPGKDPAVLTPDASVPVHVSADDKVYAVRRTFLEYRVGRLGAFRTVPLADVRDTARVLPAVTGGPGALARVRPTSGEAVVSLPLAALTRDDGTPVGEGDVLFVRGAADDWDDVTPAKEPGRSGLVEIRVASAASVEAWLEVELAKLRNEVARTRDQQQEARQKAGEVVTQPDGTLSPIDRDRLLTAEQTQRQVRGRIGDARDGLKAKADVLAETVRANALPRSNTTDRVQAAADVLGRLADRDLPVIEPTVAEARQLGGQAPRPGQEKAVPDLLRKAGRHQKVVEEGLTDLYDLLTVWGAAGDIRGEARVLRDFIQRQAADVEKMGTSPQAGDLERAGTRADQAGDQATQLMARATRLAGEKDKQAAATRATADAKLAEATALRDKAAALPPGTPEKSGLNAQAALLEGEAADLRADAARAESEAKALRDGIAASGGAGVGNDLRDAGRAVRKNQRSDASGLLRSAANRLDRMIEALTEKNPDTAPDLRKMKKGADDLDTLAGAQDDIRRRAAEAGKIDDPEQRAAELRKLAAEQERLIQRTRDVLQRLQRERADATARDVRVALDRMEAARTDLENGNPGIRPQNDAVERLDNARDRLDAAVAAAPERLADEKRRKMAEKVKGLLDRQKAAIAEADRLHKKVADAKGWDRDTLTAYGDLAEKFQQPIATEVRTLEKDFEPLPVLARVVKESADAMDKAVERVAQRLREIDPALAFDPELEASNDRRVKRPMDLAARRLEQLLEALKQDDPQAKKDVPPKKPDGMGPMNPPAGGGDRDLVPPLAQLKILRALQAELNQRTAEFDKLHPEKDKLTEEERAELKELEDAQRDMAALFEEMAKVYQELKQDKEEKAPGDAKPEKPDNPPPEKP